METNKSKKTWQKPIINSLSVKGLTLGGNVVAALEGVDKASNKRIS